MIEKPAKFIIIVSLSVLFSVIAAAPCKAVDLYVTPQLGLSAPASVQAGYWTNGYSLGLEGYLLRDNPLQIGSRLSFHRWKPDADDLLRLNGHEMNIEQYEGWRVAGEIAVISRYKLPWIQSRFLHAWVDAGAGIFYVRSSQVNLKGYYSTDGTAVNREIHLEPVLEVVPGINLGMTFMVNRQFQPALRMYHVFTSDDGGYNIFSATLGLVAR